MPLTPVTPTEATAANQIAQRMVGEILQKATQFAAIRANGVPEIPAQPARELPDGRVIPARPATPAVSATAINAALGEDNCTVLDALQSAIGAA